MLVQETRNLNSVRNLVKVVEHLYFGVNKKGDRELREEH